MKTPIAAFAAAATLGLAAATLAQPAAAQMQAAAPAAPTVVRGAVLSLAGNVLTVKPEKGAPEKIELAPTWSVAVMKPVAIDAIQPGSFIGTSEMPGKGDKGRSLEVHVFPPGVKMGEGHYGWDLKPGSMMTNGTVGKVKSGAKGRELEVSYTTGMRRIVVPPKVPVVQITDADRGVVKKGVSVFVMAMPKPAGGLVTGAVGVGADGAKPPM